MDKYEILEKVFGYKSFRSGQEELIDALLDGSDVLGIMPTGAGKSICYQIPALLMDGLTLVISPLISLMEDQVEALAQVGVRAAYLNSTLSQKEYDDTLYDASRGKYKLIYIAPERLWSPRFTDFAGSIKLSAVIVDEAHCVSQWGHDFREGYLDIKDFINSLIKRPALGAFTATATESVRRDIVRLLDIQNPHELITGFDRQNLYFETRKPKDKDAELIRLIKERPDQSGIVYCSTRANTESVYELLLENSISAACYHAGMALSKRQKNQSDFVYDNKKVMVATNAFGMGIDKSNVSFVIHYNMPKNVESYYQEAGRAGRDGENADCILLYSPKDVSINRFLINSGQENSDKSPEFMEALKEHELELLKFMTFYSTTTECLRRYMLRYFGENAPIYCGNCSSCNQTYDSVDITVDAQKIISCVIRIERRGNTAGKSTIASILHGSGSAAIKNRGYDKLPTYGIMSDTPVRRIVYTIEYLLEHGYLSLSGGEYPTVSSNGKSVLGLRGEEPLIMKVPQIKEKTKKENSSPNTVTDGSDELFKILSQLRFSLAKQEGLPAYMIFSNATLQDMCRKMPDSQDEFLDVSGVGQTKLSKYGDVFIDAIRSYKTS